MDQCNIFPIKPKPSPRTCSQTVLERSINDLSWKQFITKHAFGYVLSMYEIIDVYLEEFIAHSSN